MSTFRLMLDTTPPEGVLTAPAWTRRGSVPIVAEYDEALDDWQVCYVDDSEGTRHDFILSNDGDTLSGVVSFSRVADGNAVIHIEARDEVHNLRILEKTIVISGHLSPLRIISDVKKRILEAEIKAREISAVPQIREVEDGIYTRDIDSSTQAREIADSVDIEE